MQAKATLEDTLALMRDLRRRCEWDAAQTHDSLRPYLAEESAELDDAIREQSDARMRDELGDVLLQVLFHSVVAEERGGFDIGDVAGALVAKMKARHPHLYGDGVRQSWEEMKAKHRRTLTEGLATSLSSLHRAHRLQDRAAGVGFDWPDVHGPCDKVREEIDEVAALLHRVPAGPRAPIAPDADLEGELGDLLFAVVNLCRKAGVHSDVALDKANAKFVRRFEGVERLAEARGLPIPGTSLEVLDRMWDEIKRDEPNA